jgi:hypothetical protein
LYVRIAAGKIVLATTRGAATRTISPAAEGLREHLIEWLAGKDDLGKE